MYKTKIQQLYNLWRPLLLGVAGLFILLSWHAPLLAQTVAQGFNAESSLERGTIVVLDEEDNEQVVPARIDRVQDLYGVVINPNDASVTLSSEGADVFVATTGRYNTLVSTQNGHIRTGDYVTVSSLEGIGMKADDIVPVIIGRALADFDGSNAASTAQVGEINVSIARIPVDIQVGSNPWQRPTEADLPEFLRRAAESIAGQPVAAVRVYIALFIFLVSTFIAGSLMYGGVRSSIISIGRNPLSKKSIIRGMLQVILVGLIIFIIGVFGVYLLLRM